jgi:hypothetical protein
MRFGALGCCGIHGDTPWVCDIDSSFAHARLPRVKLRRLDPGRGPGWPSQF